MVAEADIVSCAGSEVSNTSLSPVPAAFENFHGVTIESMIWLDSTATIRNQQHFDDVGQRKYYVDMFRLQAPSVRLPVKALIGPDRRPWDGLSRVTQFAQLTCASIMPVIKSRSWVPCLDFLCMTASSFGTLCRSSHAGGSPLTRVCVCADALHICGVELDIV